MASDLLAPAIQEAIRQHAVDSEVSAISGIAAADNPSHQSYIYFPEARTKFQLTSLDLKETRRRSQWLCLNTFARVLRRLARYLGTPRIKANTRDAEWNKAADTWFQENYIDRVGGYDASGKYSAETFLTNCIYQAWRDSDCTAVHLNGPGGEPQCVAIEANRIDNGLNMGNMDRWQDGVLTDWNDRHLYYNVLKNPPGAVGYAYNQDYIQVPAWKCHMFGDFESQSSVRGTPALIHCVADLLSDRQISQANEEIIKLTKQYGILLTTELGGQPAAPGVHAPSGPRRREVSQPAQTASTSGNSTAAGSTAVTKNTTGTRTVAEVMGGTEIHSLPPGTKAQILQPANYMPEQRAMREHIYANVALGLGVPVELLFLLDKLTGPGVRFVLRQSQEWRNYWLKSMQTWMSVDWARRIEWAIRTGRLPRCKDPEFARHYFTMPRAITIDDGRSAAAVIASLSAGTTNLAELFGEKGMDWREETAQRIDEIKFILEDCKRKGVDPAYYFTSIRPDLVPDSTVQENAAADANAPAQP